MQLIVGLGNPEPKYFLTRHNIGFRIVDEFAKINSCSWERSLDFGCYFSKKTNFVLVKPTTYMNRSGFAVASVSNFYNIEKADILVIHDDIDLDFGKIRLSFGGSSAGNRGVESVISSLSTGDFARLRFGVGHPSRKENEYKPVDSYVLSDFDKAEEKELADLILKSTSAISSFMDEGIQATMNRFN